MEITLQQLSDAGINPFAVQLLVESWLRHDNSPPVTFVFNGVKISIETAPVVVQAAADMSSKALESGARSEPPPWVPG